MRVTSTMTLRSTMRDLGNSLERLQRSQGRMASGKNYERVSDDPRAATDALNFRGRIDRHDQLARTAADTKNRLAITDTTLLSASDALNRVKELAVRAANTGASDDTSRSALASELRSLRTEMLAAARTEYLGRPLFSGTAAAAYDDAGVFVGNDTVESRTVAQGVTTAMNVTGEQVFGSQASPTGDVFAILDRLANAIDAGDTAAIATEHANVDQARDLLGKSIAEVGRRAASLDEVQAASATRRMQLVERLSEIEDIDLAQAVIDVTTNETAHQAALAAAARAMPPSLASYLR